jgi:dihydrofolate reductase
MKTTLWATLTANGSYAQATPDQPPRQEALADFAAHAAEAKNFVVGRRTFETFQAQPSRAGDRPFTDTDIVVVTARPLAVPGVTSVASPRAALDYLASRGRSVALLAGGAQLHDAFLADDLVDELVLTVAPVLAGKGLQIALPQHRYRELVLASARELGGGLVQLRYTVRRS